MGIAESAPLLGVALDRGHHRYYWVIYMVWWFSTVRATTFTLKLPINAPQSACLTAVFFFARKTLARKDSLYEPNADFLERGFFDLMYNIC